MALHPLKDFITTLRQGKRGLNVRGEVTLNESKLHRRLVLGSSEQLIAPQEELVLRGNHAFDDNVTSWAIYGIETNRPMSDLLGNNMQLIIEYSTESNGFNEGRPGGNSVFRAVIPFSEVDTFDQGLLSATDPNVERRTNIIIQGRYFNVPMAKYMRISLKNNLTGPSIRFLPFIMIEEGNF